MITPLDPRHLKRQTIVQQLFEWEQQQKIPERKFMLRDNAEETSKNVINRINQIDKIIEAALVKWTKDKVNNVDLAILRLAIFELNFEKKQPVKVIIDEAIELAKEFGGESSAHFVNGILANVSKNVKSN